jgi:large subunit ribosomal protein L3
VGHRKKHAPKRGSLAYLPRGRAARPVGRVRFWPEVEEGPVLLGFAGYKAGMSYVFIVEDKQRSPNFGKEVAYPVTIIDTPPMTVCAVRAYTKDVNGLKTLTEAWASSLPKDFERVKSVPKEADTESGLKKMKENLDKIVEFRVKAATQPRQAGVPKKKPDIMEVKVGGASVKEQFEYVKKILGKTVQAEDVFKEGQFVDAIAVSKGKGWQGVVKRWGVRILQHKSNKTKRGIATLGPWGPKDGGEVTPEGGFLRYGPVKNSYVMLKGSVPGAAKRLVRLRYAARPPKHVSENPPQITYVSVESVQGA